ncbi:Phage-related minor tail protein [[Actinobacillus] rossii]|uniref:Phage-related minor tail protein n=1 Tax=[Actinobacillus] rossii TaxID=123820 RepID=A0A380U1G2_9PAST|nr:Phage-related minor tail protein [[Actinobacillus] rossii]
MADMNLKMAVTLKDQASAGLKKVADEVEKGAKRATDAAKRGAKEQQDAARQTDVLQSALSGKAENYARRLAQTRQTLGIRSEHQIQREIQRTEAAYNRLARSGRASATELNRAYAASRQQIAQLNAEMGKMPAPSFGSKMMGYGRVATGVAAGVSVGATLAARPIKNTADYNLALAYLSNTAYADRDNAGKKAGMDNIHNVIKDATVKYGGSKETAMEALGSLVSQGKVSVDTALNLLPSIQKNAMATGSSTTDIANLVNAGLGYGLKENEIQDFLDYANVAGKAGGFELRDMAQYAPSLFAKAKGAGLEGMDGAKKMFKMLQQIYNVSGGSSETATNTMNFLSKVNSQDTLNRAKKIEYTGKDGKHYDGVDLKKSMMSYMNKGQDTVDAFLSVVDDILVGDKEYQKLKQLVDKAQSQGERNSALESVANYVQGSRVGELVADQQAWLGLFGIRSQRQTGQNVEEAYINAKGETDRDALFISEQAAVKFQSAGNKYEMTQVENFNSVTNWTADLAQKMTEYGEQYPALSQAMVGAVDSIKILGTAAFAAAGSLALLNLGKGGNAVGGAIDVATTVGGNGRVAAGGKWGKLLNVGSRALGVAGAATMLTSSENADERRMREYHWDNTKLSDKERYEIASKAVSNGWADDKYLLDIEKFGSNPDEVKRLTAQFKQNKFKLDFKKLNSWFSSDDEKAKMLTSFNRNWHELTPEQQASVSEQRSKFEARQKIKANNILNGVGSWVANDEERAYAKTVLDGKADWQVVQNKFYAGLNNPNLGKSSVLKGNAVSAGDGSLANIDFTPLTQSQEQQMNTFQTTLTADIQSLGKSISAGLLSAIQAQTTTLQNKITVELEGRVVAEQVSEQQYQNFKRGV